MRLEPQRILRLGLPLRSPGHAWVSASLMLCIYAATLARDLTFYDSPELALVAHQLGVGHPIGMPTHTLLGYLFAHALPTPHLGLTLMSALFGALCAIPAWSLAERFVELQGQWRAAWVAVFVGVGASLIAWEPASRVEVYTLAVFLSLWGCARAAFRPGLGAGLAFGLGASTHAVIAVAHALAMAPRLAAPGVDASSVGARARSGARFVAGGLLGLLPYGLVPLAASDPDRFAWGAPRDAASFFEYLRGADYVHNQGIATDTFVDHLGALGAWSLSHGSLPVGLVGATAFLLLGRRREGLGWAVVIAGALCVGFVAANVVFHPDVPDYCGYLLGPLWLSGIGLAAASAELLRRGGRFVLYGSVLSALPALALAPSFGHLLQVRDRPSLARVLAEGALREAPSGAILIVEADHYVAPLLFVQEVEALREDVVVVPMGLASSRWYWEHLYRRHRELRPFELVAPGGDDRLRRIRRFLDARPTRRVLTESSELASAIGRAPCGVGALVWTTSGGACGDPGPAAMTQAIDLAAPFRRESLEVAARVGEARGVALWRLGRGDSALDAMVAGLARSGVGPSPVEMPEHAAPLQGPLPGWTRPSALHDPARNLVLAGLLLHNNAQVEPALRFIGAAQTMGLEAATLARRRITHPR